MHLTAELAKVHYVFSQVTDLTTFNFSEPKNYILYWLLQADKTLQAQTIPDGVFFFLIKAN